MRINSNLAALNAWRNLNNTDKMMSKSLERLSSGLRINRAADDAAGLAISEKMRSQINGLDEAVSNAQNGISMIQTAEGAMNEMHRILQRMRELAVQSASDTLTDSDRAQIQEEVQNLKDEIDRIADNTEFNAKKLLNGNVSGATEAKGTILESIELTGGVRAQGSASTNPTSLTFIADEAGSGGNDLDVDLVDGGFDGNSSIEVSVVDNGDGTTTIEVNLADNGTDTITSTVEDVVTAVNGDAEAGDLIDAYVANGDKDTTASVETIALSGGSDAVSTDTLLADLGDSLSNSFGLIDGDTVTIDGLKNGSDLTDGTLSVAYTSDPTDSEAVSGAPSNTTLNELLTEIENTLGAKSVSLDSDGKMAIEGKDGTAESLSNVYLEAENRDLFNNIFSAFEETQAATDASTDQSVSVQIGANAGQTLAVDVAKMDGQALMLNSIRADTQHGAEVAMKVLTDALESVSEERAQLGAVQNRLEHTISNLGVASENLTAAESRIRDADMAREMSNFTRNQILMQAGSAMLAQANQKPQAVLSLLR